MPVINTQALTATNVSSGHFVKSVLKPLSGVSTSIVLFIHAYLITFLVQPLYKISIGFQGLKLLVLGYISGSACVLLRPIGKVLSAVSLGIISLHVGGSLSKVLSVVSSSVSTLIKSNIPALLAVCATHTTMVVGGLFNKTIAGISVAVSTLEKIYNGAIEFVVVPVYNVAFNIILGKTLTLVSSTTVGTLVVNSIRRISLSLVQASSIVLAKLISYSRTLTSTNTTVGSLVRSWLTVLSGSVSTLSASSTTINSIGQLKNFNRILLVQPSYNVVIALTSFIKKTYTQVLTATQSYVVSMTKSLRKTLIHVSNTPVVQSFATLLRDWGII